MSAVAARSIIPISPAPQASEFYDAIMGIPRAEYNSKFTDYNNKPAEIEGLTLTWRKRNTELIAGTATRPSVEDLATELYARVDEYLKLQKIRNDCERIKELFDVAIKQLESKKPEISESVKAFLIVLQKANVSVDTIVSGVNKIFVTDLDEMKAQRARISGLFDSIATNLFDLKKEGDVLAIYRNTDKGVIQTLTSWIPGKGWFTPDFQAAIDVRVKELALAAKPAEEQAAQ